MQGAVRARPARTAHTAMALAARLASGAASDFTWTLRDGQRTPTGFEGGAISWPLRPIWGWEECTECDLSVVMAKQGAAGAEAEVDQQFTSVLDDLIAGRTVSKALNLHFWTTRPCLSQNQPMPVRQRRVPARFTPQRSSPNLVTETVIWQYRMNVTGIPGGLVDLDLSTARGLKTCTLDSLAETA